MGSLAPARPAYRDPTPSHWNGPHPLRERGSWCDARPRAVWPGTRSAGRCARHPGGEHLGLCPLRPERSCREMLPRLAAPAPLRRAGRPWSRRRPPPSSRQLGQAAQLGWPLLLGSRTCAVAGTSTAPVSSTSSISSATTSPSTRRDAAAEDEIALGEGAAAVLEGEREHAPARPRPVPHELVEPCALERAVHEDVVVALELRKGTVVVDAVRVVRRGAEQEELRAARVLHERRQRVARLHVFEEALAHRTIRRPRAIATISPAWFV